MRTIKSNCVACRMFLVATVQSIMADLPVERLACQSSPFTNNLVDYFGPFYDAICRTTAQRWGLLFTCLTTRAVLVEILLSMDACSCVMGVELFVSRRGTPAIIWSDKGTNFVGAEKNYARISRSGIPSIFQRKLPTKALSGGSNPPPPSGPNQGGIWEKMLRSFWQILYTLLGTRCLTDEVLNTTFRLVENKLNSRPLTIASADPSNLGALTPKAIWSRWIKEYVPTLH